MVSWMDNEPDRRAMIDSGRGRLIGEDAPPLARRIFTFINGYGDTRKVEAVNVTEAWIELGRLEEASTDALIERDWRVKR